MDRHPVTYGVLVPLATAATLFALEQLEIVSRTVAWVMLGFLAVAWVLVFVLMVRPAAMRHFMSGTIRTGLERAYPIRRQLEKAKRVEGLWLTVLLNERDLVNGRIGRVILPFNNPETIRRLLPLTGYAADGELSQDILKATRLVGEFGGRARWLKDFPEFTMLLADPDSQFGWIHLELLIPFEHPDTHPVFRLRPLKDQEGFARLRRLFDELWDKADEPDGELAG